MKRQLFAIGFATASLVSALASPLSAQTLERTVSVKVIKAGETGSSISPVFDIGKFFAEFPDFYVVPTIDGQQLPKSKTISETAFPTFNYTVASKVPLSKARIPISLKLMDSDTLDSDDTADISPIPGTQVLLLTYEPNTRTVYGSDGNQLGGQGQEITVQGDRQHQVAKITFTITHKDAPASNPQPPKDPSCPVASTDCQTK